MEKWDEQERVIWVAMGPDGVVEVPGLDLCPSRRGVERKNPTRDKLHVVFGHPVGGE